MAEINIKLKPFVVPNFIREIVPPGKRQEGFKEGRLFALSELDVETLNHLCDEFRASVLAKAANPDSEQ